MMRCKKHLPDLTSTVGVCASCLRERLQPLLAAQAQAQSPPAVSDDHHRLRKPEPNAPPLNFPRSVSPHVSHRKSDSDHHRREKLFHSTPQVGRDLAGECDGATASSKRRLGRFWMLSNLFRIRSNKTESSSGESCEPSSSATPPSWFWTILPARRQNHGAIDQRRCRGLSPAVTDNFSEELEGKNRSESGLSTEASPQNRKQTTTTVARRSRLGPAGKKITNMAFCLSPLVRASPNRHWSQKGAQEIGSGGSHHLSTAASFCANRSRKLADFGRLNHNR